MRRFGQIFLLLVLCLILSPRVAYCAASEQASAHDVRIAILLSRAQVEMNWKSAQISGHGWAAVANLAGVPYDTLFIEDALDSDSGKTLLAYDSLILAQVNHLSESHYTALCDVFDQYLSAGGNLIVDGPLALFDENRVERTTERIRSVLGVEYIGFHAGTDYRIRVEKSPHYATRSFLPGEYVTQHLDGGLNVMRFTGAGEVLLTARSTRDFFPFLSVREQDGSRLALISDFGASAGVASFFRNQQPQGFYANRLYDSLVSTLHWVIYGDLSTPFPTLQLSNANLTAMVRLDADQSYRLDEQIETMEYLIDLAEETGVVSLYGWVSADAADAGWEQLAELGGRLEATGGQIGTHSRYHDLDIELDDEIAKRALDASVVEIERAMLEHGQSIGGVDFLINPNNTIPMFSYDHIARRFSFYMTHGFEQNVPLAYGNLTWNAGDNRDFVVINNSPTPDYQWFYAPGWDYSSQQVTAYQEAIFDHMFSNVGRGVIFNQMWHDYGVTSTPLEPDMFDWWGLWPQDWPDDQRPLYDALAAKFATEAIYCPDAVDLGQKLRAMAQWSYSWNATGDRIHMTLDLSQADSAALEQYAGGMGIRVENYGGRIQSVVINGNEHPAFSDNVVILPNLNPATNEIEIRLGREPVRSSHLTYVSKRMPTVRVADGEIEVSILTRSKARFAFYAEKPSVLLNADWQEWNRLDDLMLHGYVTSDRQVVLREYEEDGFRIVRSTLPIIGFSQGAGVVRIELDEAEGHERALSFRSSRAPKRAAWQNGELPIRQSGQTYRIELPEFRLPGTLELEF